MTHICVNKLTIIGSDNCLSPDRRQAIMWTNAGILLIRPSGTNFSEILIAIDVFSFKKIYLKMSSAKWRPFCLGLNVLTAFSGCSKDTVIDIISFQLNFNRSSYISNMAYLDIKVICFKCIYLINRLCRENGYHNVHFKNKQHICTDYHKYH